MSGDSCALSGSARKQGGFVLLMTVVLLAIAAVSLVIFTRRSVSVALAAQRGVEDLQLKWARRSCVRTLLPQTELALKRMEEGADSGVASLPASLVLGRCRVDMVFADEQAKVNLNAMLSRRGIEQLHEAVREWQDLLGDRRMIELTPMPDDVRLIHQGRAFVTWSQVIRDDPARPEVLPPPLASAATMWGDGRLRLHRASELALVHTCRPLLDRSQIRKLFESRVAVAATPAAIAGLLKTMGLQPAQLTDLQSRLTAMSSCYSMWWIGKLNGRVATSVYVLDQSAVVQSTIGPVVGDATTSRIHQLHW